MSLRTDRRQIRSRAARQIRAFFPALYRQQVRPPGTLRGMEPGDAKSPLTQLRRGVIEFCVLALLEQEPMYAVDLVRRLAEVDAIATTEGTIYPLLSRLRRDGSVTTEWQESTSGPPRRYYSITPGGTRAMREFRSEWTSFVDGVNQFLRIGGRRAG